MSDLPTSDSDPAGNSREDEQREAAPQRESAGAPSPSGDDKQGESIGRRLVPELSSGLGDIQPHSAMPDSEPDSSELRGEMAGSAVPDSIPGYEIVREIHRGGQGVVYQAIQKTTKRKVAIKVMREGPFAGKRDRARFEREVEVLGLLNHPRIVNIHDSGTSAGSFYFVMDYISGQPLDTWMASGNRSIEETLRLFAKICEAVNAAHLRGVVHRDLKPGNIRVDTNGEPHVLDFGLAKVAAGAEASVVTMTGQFMGSLPWASPEQAEGTPSKIDIRTDVYSLGVILYQMLTGKFPYEIVGNMPEVLDHIIKTEPVKPSAVRHEINDEVETIVLKCLSKARERRYQTAGELARDIGHYLNGEAIEAKRDSALYILRKHLRQYRFPVAVAAGFVLMLAAALFVSLALLGQARRAETLADQQRSLALDRERIAQVAYADGALEQGTALHLAGRGQDSRTAFMRARDALAALKLPTLAAEVGLYRSLREFEPPINTLVGHTDGLMAVAWFPDGIRACSASEDGTVRLWNVQTGQEIRSAFGGRTGASTSVAVSPDGRYALCGGEDGTVRLWDIETGKEEIRPFAESEGQVRGVAFSPDGRFAVTAATEGNQAIRLWDVRGGALTPVDRSFETPGTEAYSYYGVAFSPDGRRILAATYEKKIWIWDLETKQTLELSGHTNYVIAAAFSPDGERVLSASYDQALILWDARTGTVLKTLRGHTAGVRGVAFVGRGDAALSCSMDGSLKLWKVETGEVVRTFAGHTGGIRGVSVSSDGRRAISAGIDRTLRVWNLAQNTDAPVVREAGTVTSLSCSSDGTTFVSGDSTGSVKLRDLATFRVLQTFTGHTQPIDTATTLPDARRLFAADSAGGWRFWDILSGCELSRHPGQGPGEDRNLRGGAWCFTSVSADGRLALCSKPDATMDLRSIESGTVIRKLVPPCKHDITSVAVSPDSRHALSADKDGDIYYWDLDSGHQWLFRKPAGFEPGRVDCLVFSADGKCALTGGHELTIRLWDLTTRQQIREFIGPTLVVKGLGFGHGGRTVFSVGLDQTLRMWDARTERELNLPAQCPMDCFALAVVPPGDAVLAGSGPSVTLWDVSRFMRHLEFAPRLDAALAVLRSNPDDGAALKTLGDWYAFRGVNDWALQVLEKARAHGASISSVTMGRCYWQLGQLKQAAGEFRSAIAHGEAPADYLSLCLAAVTAARGEGTPTTSPTQPGAVFSSR